MRSKAPLLLMEQMVMLLVFALAAALCLQAFAASERISARSEVRDRAVALVQTAAETIRSCGGTPDQALRLAAERLDGEYAQGTFLLEREDFRLTAQPVSSGIDGLCAARVAAEDGESLLFELEIAWQGEQNRGT